MNNFEFHHRGFSFSRQAFVAKWQFTRFPVHCATRANFFCCILFLLLVVVASLLVLSSSIYCKNRLCKSNLSALRVVVSYEQLKVSKIYLRWLSSPQSSQNSEGTLCPYSLFFSSLLAFLMLAGAGTKSPSSPSDFVLTLDVLRFVLLI